MVQEQWLQLKMTFLFFSWVALTFGGREQTFGGEVVNEQIFGWLGDSPIPAVGKTLYKLCQQVFIYNEKARCTSHTSCTKVAILLLQDLNTLCVTDIYVIYCVFRSKPSKIKQSEMCGTICQNIKPPTLTHIPSSVYIYN